MIDKNTSQFVSAIRGRNDGVLRYIEEVPGTAGGGYVDARFMLNGVRVQQTINSSRIEKVKIEAGKRLPT